MVKREMDSFAAYSRLMNLAVMRSLCFFKLKKICIIMMNSFIQTQYILMTGFFSKENGSVPKIKSTEEKKYIWHQTFDSYDFTLPLICLRSLQLALKNFQVERSLIFLTLYKL